MKTISIKEQLNHHFMFTVLFFSLLLSTTVLSAQTVPPIKNIVLVHGAFADGSSWKSVYNILTKKGYNVSIVQNPLTSLQADVDATNSVINVQDGPVILVGHSWGGTIITEAGMNSKVVALVYISAFVPDEGENSGQWTNYAPSFPEAGFTNIDQFGLIYFDSSKFHSGFSADLTPKESAFFRDSQVPIKAKSFGETVKNAAWKIKPSYAILPTQDKALNPIAERFMYQRAKSKITEIKGSHVVYISQPKAVAKVIINASKELASKK